MNDKPLIAEASANSNTTFINKAVLVHGSKYDYSKVVYVNAKTKVEIVCPIHGSFFQTSNTHLRGRGCPTCGRLKLPNDGSKPSLPFENSQLVVARDTPSFVARARQVHNSRYDYSKVVYLGGRTRVGIICSEHGPFQQVPEMHTAGRGCPKCGQLKSLTTPQDGKRFIADAVKAHGNRYDYSKVVYVNAKTKVEIVCPVHGSFWQLPYGHSKGKTCPECSNQLRTKTQEDFVLEALEVHKGKYDYSKAEYINSYTKIEIICPTHGPFWQLPNGHLSIGCGCPKCGNDKDISKAEQEVFAFITGLVPETEVEQSNRTVLKGKELDIYLPEFKLAIEYNGLYHHSSFGKGLRGPKPADYHQDKMLACRAAGISLLQIFEDEWINPTKQEIWKSIIRHKLGKTKTKIYARKCTVRPLEAPETRLFLDENHLMGTDSAPVRLGLFFSDKLVSVLTFAKPSLAGGNKKYDWNLSRFAVLKDTTIVGGFSRLLHYFKMLHPSTTLSTAADLRYSIGDVYTKNGFQLTHETRPNYWYWRASTNKKRHHRFNFRKQLLEEKLEVYDENLTEKQNMVNNGWNTIFDAGNAMFEFVN